MRPFGPIGNTVNLTARTIDATSTIDVTGTITVVGVMLGDD